METKERTHTPGPWTTREAKKLGAHRTNAAGFDEYGDWWAINVASASGHSIGYVNSWGDSVQESEANAALIAAAPDLLAACEAALTRLRTIERDKGIHSHETIPELEAAIARARS